LLLYDSSGGRHALTLRGLERLRATDLREGNIILDVVVRACEVGDSGSLRDLFDLGTTDRDEGFLENLIARATKDRKLLVEISPSYGCSLLALCQHVEMENR
jgi:hypothetical protein